jgi:glycosyltransferase involved in cell wall biosynthesis
VQFENVRLLGSQAPQAVAALLQRASIYALPARYEPFGLSVLEAALSGCALVLGDIPSLREVWGDAALYVPPDRADVLASTLKALMQNHERLDDLAQAARRRAGFYTVERMTAAYLNLYGRLRQASITEPADTFATLA